MHAPMSLLELVDLVKEFPAPAGLLQPRHGVVRAVNHVSLQVEQRETVGVVGESGSGKTTLARLALHLIDPTRGHVRFLGRSLENLSAGELRALRAHMAIIFQDPYASLNPRQHVDYILGRPFDLHTRLSRREIRRKVLNLLDRVGLSPAVDFARKFPHQLSGGQRQRVAIGRAVALEPKLIVADEPVSSLDVSVRAQILNLLRDLQSDLGGSYLFISHDLSVVHSISDRVAVMYEGEIVEEGRAPDVFLNPAHPYTQLLVASIPEHLKERRVDFVAGKGDAIGAKDPQGCIFRLRCPYAMPRCSEAEPPLLNAGEGHSARCFLLEETLPPANWVLTRAWTDATGSGEPPV